MLNYIKSNSNKILEISFLSVFLVLPFEDLFSLIAVIILLVFTIVINRFKNIGNSIKENPFLLLLFAYFLLSVISLLYTTDFSESIKKTSKLLAYIFIPLAFLLLNPDNKLLEKAKKTFVYGILLFCVFSISKLLFNYVVNFEQSHWYNFIQVSMYHKYMPEDAMYINTAFIYVLFGNWFNKNYKLLISILFLSIIILFGVRLGLFVFVLIVFVYFIKNIKSLLNLRSLFIVLFSIILSVTLINQSRYVNDKFYDTLEKIGIKTSGKVSDIGENYHKINLRKQLYSSAFDLIKEKPIIGYGAGVEKKELSKVFNQRRFDLPNYNAHSQVLSTWIQYGIIGVLILTSLLVGLVFKNSKDKNLPNSLLLLVMIISMTVESYLEIQQGLFYFCIFISILILEKNE